MAVNANDLDVGLLRDMKEVLKKHAGKASFSKSSSRDMQPTPESRSHTVPNDPEQTELPSASESLLGLMTHLIELESRVREAEQLGDLTSVNELGTVIRAARLKQGLTIEGLSELADVAQVTIHKLEKGSLQVQVPKLVQVIDALGLELLVAER